MNEGQLTPSAQPTAGQQPGIIILLKYGPSSVKMIHLPVYLSSCKVLIKPSNKRLDMIIIRNTRDHFKTGPQT